MATKTDLFGSRAYYKPFDFPKYFEMYEQHRSLDWTPREVPMNNDIYQWDKVLTEAEKNFLTHIFRFFTQADVDVAGAYIEHYLPRFKYPEIRMMLLDFAQRETVHINAYSLLIDTLGIPEATYKTFLEYEVMADKHDYIQQFGGDDIESVLKQLFVFSGFTEGMQLFSSFIMLLNFRRFGKMLGMGTIIEWSIRDENLHFQGMAELFKDLVKQHKKVWTDDFKGELYSIANKMVELEDLFIDLAFEMGGIEGLEAEDVKKYIRYISNTRLHTLGLKAIYEVKENPLPWVEEMLNLPLHTNFFENRVSSYSRGVLRGDWSDFWKTPVN